MKQKLKVENKQGFDSWGATFRWTLFFLIVFLLGTEVIVRLPQVQSHLFVPSVGLPRSLDYKVHYLAQLETEGNRVNCIFFGSSVVMRGVQAELFSEELRRETGRSLTCFNFGLAGTSGPSNDAVLARLIVQEYHPDYFFYGIAPEQLTAIEGDDNGRQFVDNNWVQYKSGNFNLKGWLIDRFEAIRYFQGFHLWLTSPSTFRVSDLSVLTTYGDSTVNEFRYDVTRPPDPDVEGFIIDRYTTGTLDPERLVALESLLELRTETNLILFTPANHPTFDDYFGENIGFRDELGERVNDLTAEKGVVMIGKVPELLFEDGDWIDRTHLNPSGAVIFTKWLAGEVAKDLPN